MPVVPKYEVDQVALQPVQRPREQNYRSAQIDGAVGAATAGVGNVLFDIGLRERERADDAQLLGANRQLIESELELIDAPETGALSKRGRDALGLPEQVLPEWDKRVGNIEQGMNERVRARFRTLANDRRTDVQRKLGSHITRETDKFYAEETEANVAAGLNSIAVNYRDPDRVAREGELMTVATRAMLERSGASPVTVKAATDALTAKVRGTVLDQMLNARDYRGAVEYYKLNRDALGDQADEYGAKVNQAEMDVLETDETDRIVDQFGAGPAGIAEARNIADPVLRERVEGRIDRERVRAESAIALRDKALRTGAWQRMADVPPGTTALNQVFTPTEQLAINGQPGLRQELESEIDRRLKGLEIATDPRTVDTLSRMQAERPDQFKTLDLSTYYDKLAPADRQTWLQRQADMNDPGKAVQYATEAKQLDDAYYRLKIPAGTKGAKKRGEFDLAYNESKRVFVQQNKREPSDEERRTIINGLLLPMARPRSIMGVTLDPETVPSYRADPKRDAVPETERRLIVDAYRQIYNRAPTEVEIVTEYMGSSAQ